MIRESANATTTSTRLHARVRLAVKGLLEVLGLSTLKEYAARLSQSVPIPAVVRPPALRLHAALDHHQWSPSRVSLKRNLLAGRVEETSVHPEDGDAGVRAGER